MLIEVRFKFHCNATNNKDVLQMVYKLPNHPSCILNFNYFINQSIEEHLFYFSNTCTKEAPRTNKCVLEGADSAICGLTLWRKPENSEKTLTLDRQPQPCHMPIPGFEDGLQQ